MRSFGVFGKVYAEADVIGSRYYNVAMLLGAWAVKNWELARDKWDARYRCVYGGNQPRRADGSTALYATNASLPASLRDLRIFAVIASLHSWKIWLGDVTGAYLNATAPPDTYVTLQEEQIDHVLDAEEAKKYRDLKTQGRKPVVQLLKALYGHTQAGFLWEAEARRCLMKMGFVNFSDVSSAWYVKYDQNSKLICMLLLYVDDFMLAGDPDVVRQTVAQMQKIWILKGGDIHSVNESPILGTQFNQYLSENGTRMDVIIDQRSYASHSVGEFLKMTGESEKKLSKSVDLPSTDRDQNLVFADQKIGVPDDPIQYGQYKDHGPGLIGKLMWLARTGWFHLTVAVQGLSREVQQWTHTVDEMAVRIFSYISKFREGVLLLRVSPQDRKSGKLKLLIFSDADHAGNVTTRKSVSGCAVVLSGPNGTWAVIDWISKSQRTISLSTAEAELLAAQVALRECLSILILFDLLQLEVATELLVDSSAALSVLLTGLSNKLRYAAKSQGLACAWCNAVLHDFNIRARKVATDHNIADLFTKSVSKFTFSNLLTLCGWVTPADAGRARCANKHESPAHDEPVRCLNFVDKVGAFCAACQEGKCRCFNGAQKWDLRDTDTSDRIPIRQNDGKQ